MLLDGTQVQDHGERWLLRVWFVLHLQVSRLLLLLLLPQHGSAQLTLQCFTTATAAAAATQTKQGNGIYWRQKAVGV